MLKADFHMHTGEDPLDTHIKYNSKTLIKYCAKLGYKVLAITNHMSVFFSNELKNFAKEHGILLIPGTEAVVEGKEIVILNPPLDYYEKKWQDQILKIKDLEKLRNENAIVMAPHPFFPRHSCLKRKLIENINVFDAIEYSHYYYGFLNFNIRSRRIAKKHNKPLIGTSDAHRLMQINHTYTMLDCDQNKDSVLEAIRKNRIKLVTRRLPFAKFFRIGIDAISSVIIANKQKLYKHANYNKL